MAPSSPPLTPPAPTSASTAKKFPPSPRNYRPKTPRNIIDATNLLLLPGGIDVHTHLDMPFGGTTSADDFETGTIAAAFGGTTTLIDFAIQYKGQTLRHAFDTWMKKADDKATIDYAFHCIITDLGSAQLEEMGELIREGVTSFKLFMAYPGVFMLDDATHLQSHAPGRETLRPDLHARRKRRRHRRDRSASAGRRKTRPEISRAHAPHHRRSRSHLPRHRPRRNGRRPVYIVHLSCNEALEKVREARDRGLPAYAETCPQYLYLSLENMDAPGFEGAKYVFTPPLREKWHQEKLWQGLRTTRCKSSPPTTARSALRNKKN